MGSEGEPPGDARHILGSIPREREARSIVATRGEKRRELRKFLVESFNREEFKMFLLDHDLADVAAAVYENAPLETYFSTIIEALDRWRRIDDRFFDHLREARPNSGPAIRDLAESWLAVSPAALITSDHDVVHRSIVDDYPSLRDHAIDFGNELKVADRFVGRNEIFRRLADFASRRPCGYFRVVADAGLGKTALAAAAAKRWKAPAFFAKASGGPNRPDQCLNHLAVELIVRFGLDYDRLPARAGEDSVFLGQILAVAAARAEGPLWIVVDALDEADPPGPGRNPLLLPDQLPRGVFVLLTHRPGDLSLSVASGTVNEEYPVAASDADQRADIESHLRAEAERLEIRQARDAANPPISADSFVASLKDRSEGNFKYLDYVLADIAARQPGFDPLELESLPSGLRGYYQQFWSRMEQVKVQEGWDEWDRLYGPVITFLAAAREAVPASWLGAMVDRPAEEIEQRALKPWRRFLSEEDRGHGDRRRPRRWRVVHQSFVDYLDEEAVVDLRAAHDRVATFYLSAWGDLATPLDRLFEPARTEELDDYGLRHLVEHLERSGRADDIHRLLRLERPAFGEKPAADPSQRSFLARLAWWRRRDEPVEARPVRADNAWYTARERVGQTDGYLNDLAGAARLVQTADSPDPGIEPRQCKTRIGLGIRYALMSASLNSLARSIPPVVIAALVEKRVWLASQGLAYARILSPENRADTLIRISNHLDGDEKEIVLRETLEVARAIEDQGERARALTALGRIDEALALARGIADRGTRARALAALVPRLARAGRGDEALALAREIDRAPDRVQALAALGQVEEALPEARGIGDELTRVTALASLGRLDEALATARGIYYRWTRFRTLAELAPHLAAAGRPDEALALARGIDDAKDRTDTLAALAPHLAAAGRVEEALARARGAGDPKARTRTLAELASRLVAAGRLDDALAVAREISDEATRARALAELVPRLAAGGRLDVALAATRGIGDMHIHAGALAELVPRLAAAGRARKAMAVARTIGPKETRARTLAALGQAKKALAVARGISDAVDRAKALAALGQVEEALAVARGIDGERSRGEALMAMAPRLTAAGRLDVALAAARQIGDKETRANVLAAFGRLDEAVDAAREIGVDMKRDITLAELARRLAALGRLEPALEIARGILGEWVRVGALADLMPYLTEVGQVGRALEIARQIGGESHRDRVLAALAPRLAAAGWLEQALEVARGIGDRPARAKALAAAGRLDVALAVAWGIGDNPARAKALAALAPRLVALPRSEALLLWDETLRHLATRPRGDLLADLAALASVIVALGGPEAIEETCRAIEDVGRWWP